MQNQNLNLFKPRRVAAKIHYSMISQFMFVWIKHSRPCDLKVQRSQQNPELLGICFEVANNDTIDMMCDLKNSLKIDIIDL
ncbi:hypothetical protein [Bacteroides mediterraneensis]|uniref:Uncharacterized protein n=1 Tax=Bacteroides mediterraneensis TaxID=1841856 RepID=A0ABS2ESZ5_9BACE|nr:hypothetical protein [Bacteroides mediterraneensis]MBM6757395.1 hypothetical protein [Bacteroides mediterraneensis]